MTLIPATIPYPAELPPARRAALAGMAVSVPVHRAVKLRLRSPEKIRVSEWAAKHRMVTDGAHVGPWRHEYAPHTVKVMDTFGQPYVREVWFCGVEQSGKTNTMLNCVGWCIDCDPGNLFYLMPTEDTSSKIIGGKLRPTLQQSPRLAGYLTGRQDDATLSRLSLRHGMTIFPSWANSPSAMATFTAKHCFGDEVDKYPEMAGRETDPITLIRKRNRTYKGRYKRFFASTPAGKFVHAGMKKCAQVWEWRVVCPECREAIRMDADHLVLPEDATPETVDRIAVGYACNECGVVWGERQRETAIRRGHWLAVQGGELIRPATVGFHHRAWECLDIPLAEIAAAWLRAQAGTLSEKIAWANGYEAVDYEAEHQDRHEDQILRLVDPAMPRGVVPRDPCCLVVVVDTQQAGFFYQVWAYGWGRDLETWRIDHGFVERFEHLVDIAAATWQDADGKEYRATCGIIDSGGGTNPHQPKHSRTAEVYEFCRQHPFFRPLKGRRDMAQPWNTTRLDYYPSRTGKKIPIPGGLTLYTVNVTMFKNELASKLMIEPGDPGAFHLHAEIGEDYARQMCAEYQDERGWWQCPRNKPNHHWDIGVYGMAAAEILRIRDRRPEGAAGNQRKVYSKGVQR